MALSTDIYTILRANSDVVSTFATRIYPVIGPEDAIFPYITYTLTSLSPNGSKTANNLYDDCFVTVTAYHTNITDCETYGNYIRTAMNKYAAAISSDKIHGCTMQSMNWNAEAQVTESGSPTGLAIFSVESQWKVQAKLNITE